MKTLPSEWAKLSRTRIYESPEKDADSECNKYGYELQTEKHTLKTDRIFESRTAHELLGVNSSPS